MSLADRMSFAGNGFRYLSGEYLYENVRHVDWWQGEEIHTDRKNTTKTVYSSRLIVTMANGKAIKITDKSQFSKVNTTARKDVHEVMVNAAKRLLEKTFDARMNAYERDIMARNYAEWGSYQLTATGELYYRHAFCFKLDNTKIRCILYPFRLVCLPHHRRWWSRFLHTFMFNSETIELERDRDCFLYVMRKYAGLYWANETLPLHRGKAADGSTDKPKETPSSSVPPQQPKAEKAAHEIPKAKQEVPPPPPPPKPRLGVEHYLGVLALKPDTEWAIIKTEYRGLVKRYHPDLMRGRGANEAELKHAEDTLKTINEAFGWLEDYYRMKPKR